MPNYRASIPIWLLCLAFLAGPARGGVIISEIMYNPQGSDRDSTGSNYTFNREWVELFNPNNTTVDLSGWQFGDSQDNNWASPFPLGTTLGPLQALVVTGDAASFDANWGSGINRIEVGAFPNLANSPSTSNETAAIRNQSGVIQDAVNYQNTNGWPTASGSDGNSIYLLPHALSASANDVGANWQPSSQGVYGARWVNGGGEGENHGSPGYVATSSQAPFAPSPDARWSMVILPDTQNYSKNTATLPIFSLMNNWIVDHRDQFGIQVVMQEGDLVNNNDTSNPSSGNQTGDQQWANARAAMSILDGHVPYIIALGNHDMGTTSAQTRDTQYNDYFNMAQNPLNDGRLGGITKGMMEPGKLDNAYFEIHAPDGRDLLIFALEFWPRQQVVDWANLVASQPQYANHTAVLVTHSYLGSSDQHLDANPNNYGVGGDSHDGLQLWDELIKVNENFEMVFSGHVGGDGVGYLESTGVQGNKVQQMLFNTQFETNGGNGWLRVIEFLDDGMTARVRTYSPLLDVYRTDPENAFEFTLSPLPRLIADFNRDLSVDGADLVAWQAGFGAGTTFASGDADEDGDVDGSDFLLWQRHVTAAASLAAEAPVPEPASLLLAFGASAAALAMRRRRFCSAA